MRLIDADALRLLLDEYGKPLLYEWVDPSPIRDAIEILDALPTIDAVPVIRCKDCKHYLTEDVECPCNIGLADATPDAQYTWTPEPDWFCADGERKTDNADGA